MSESDVVKTKLAPITVELTPDEIALAASHGVIRRHQKHCGHRGDRVHNMRSSWDNEINGVLAEIAWCKLRGIYWTGCGGIHAKDGGDVEIRWTHHENKGGLIVYGTDNDESVFVLADGYEPTINFIGWLWGREAKVLAEKRGAIHIVPRHMLRSFNQSN